MTAPGHEAGSATVGAARIALGLGAIGALVYAYGLRLARGDGNPFDYFGYFTNLTSSMMAVVLVVSGILALRRRTAPAWVDLIRAVLVACMIVVGVIYNTLVPGTGSAPPWVSVLLHVILPILVAADWALIGDRRAPSWRALWLVLLYPLCWITVVLIRGRTDGWVPYGFLLPERGIASLVLHLVGLLATLALAGTLVWTAGRYRGLVLVRSQRSPVKDSSAS